MLLKDMGRSWIVLHGIIQFMNKDKCQSVFVLRVFRTFSVLFICCGDKQ